MIELTFTTAFMLYLCLTLVIILGLWSYAHYYDRKREILSQEQELYLCEYCHYVYLEDEYKSVNRCPQCGSFNKHNHYTLN